MMGVGHDAAGDVQASGKREFGIRRRSDADDRELGRQLPAVRQAKGR